MFEDENTGHGNTKHIDTFKCFIDLYLGLYYDIPVIITKNQVPRPYRKSAESGSVCASFDINQDN